MEYGASCEDVARVCHAHPVSYTLSYRSSSTMSFKCTRIHILWNHTTQLSEDNSQSNLFSHLPPLFTHLPLSSPIYPSSRLCPRPSEKQTSQPPSGKLSTFNCRLRSHSCVHNRSVHDVPKPEISPQATRTL